MTKTTANAVVKVQADVFELKLPEPFNLKPIYEVELPNKWRAEIYETMLHNNGYGKALETPQKGWRALVVTSKGRRSNTFRSEMITSDPLELSLWLKNVVIELSKKTTTKTTVHVVDGLDDD